MPEQRDLQWWLEYLRDQVRDNAGRRLLAAELARQLYWDKGSLSRCLRGERLVPDTRLDDLIALADANARRRGDPGVPASARREIWASWDEASDRLARERRRSRPAFPRSEPSLPRPLYGRDDILADLDALLSREDAGRRPVALVGPPGYGKSRLAIEHAARHRVSGRQGAWLVWWVDARDRTTIEAGLHRLAVLRQLVERHARPADAVAAVMRYLALRDGWLLIFDDAGMPEQVEPYFPAVGGSVLITSRDPSWRAAAEVIDIPSLPPEDAARMLREETGRNDPELDELAAELWYVPVFLAQATRNLASTTRAGMPVPAYLDYLRTERRHALEHSRVLGDYPRLGVAVFRDALESLPDQARSLLILASYLAATDIPLVDLARPQVARHLPDALATDLPVASFRQWTTAVLASRGLADGALAAVSVHSVTQDLTRLLMDQADQARWGSSVIAALTQCLGDEQWAREDIYRAARLARHALRTFELTASSVEITSRALLFTRARAALREVSQVRDAADAVRVGERLLELVPIEARALRGRLLGELGHTVVENWEADRDGLSDRLHERALAEFASEPSVDARYYEATLLNGMARLRHRRARSAVDFDTSERLFWRAIRLYRTVKGARHWRVAQSMSNLAVAYTDRGYYWRALVLLLHAHQIDLAHFGSTHHLPAVRKGNLAYNYYRWALHDEAQGQAVQAARRLDEAAVLIAEAVEGVRLALGDASTWYAHWLRLAGQISLARNRSGDACKLLARAQAAMAAAQGNSTHPEVTHIMGILADALAANGELTQARALAHEACELAAMVLDDDQSRMDAYRERIQRLEANLDGAAPATRASLHGSAPEAHDPR